MATLIRATCSDCGDVELGTRDLVVRLCETNEAGTYVLRCPNCLRSEEHTSELPSHRNLPSFPTRRSSDLCSDCVDVELGTRDLVVRLCETNEAGTYVFRCPNCLNPVVRPADRPTIDLLISSGGRLGLWTIPSGLIEPRPIGPPLTHDDLIDFHEMLA